MSIVFKSNRPTITIELPNYKGSQIELYQSLTLGEERELQENGEKENKRDIGINMICKRIKKWNFVNEDGFDLPINKDILYQMNAEDIEYIINNLEISKKKE